MIAKTQIRRVAKSALVKHRHSEAHGTRKFGGGPEPRMAAGPLAEESYESLLLGRRKILH